MTDIEIKIPETWSEIRLSQYLAFYKAIKPYEGTNEYDRIVFERSVLHFCNISAEVLYKLPTQTLDEIKTTLTNFLGDGMKQPLVTTFTLGDTEYGFIPNLDEISYGEYLDLVSYSKEIWTFTPLLMDILYRPIVNKVGQAYTIQPYNGTNNNKVDMFKELLTMDIVWGAMAFFLDLQKDLMIDTLTCLNKQIENLTPDQTSQVKQVLAKNGLDITQLHSYLEMTSQNLKQ
jgi:hypothetical protein